MLATASFHHLLENAKSDGILCGRLLPINNNTAFVHCEQVHTVTAIEEASCGAKPIAFGVFNVCSKNQTYFVLSECDRSYRKKFVEVEYEECAESDMSCKDRNRCFKITKVHDYDESHLDLDPYYGSFADRTRQHVLTHVFDELVRMTLKTTNMDLTKNITIDLYDPEEFDEDQRDLWRDRTGFIVADNFSYYEITIKKDVLESLKLEWTQNNSSVKFEVLSPGNEFNIFDFDSNTSLYNRQEYLEFLLNIKEMRGLIAFQKNQPVGYALALGKRIIQCYADDEETASKLVTQIAKGISGDSVTMFIRGPGHWIAEQLLENAYTKRRVQRFHTRTLLSHVKWSSIFVLNVGLYLY